jgi:hypothetical protein
MFFMTSVKPVLSFVAISSMLFAGCGKDDGRIDVHPVSGKVLASGQPAEGAKVVFYPVAEELKQPGMPVPYGYVGSDGSFHLRSYEPDDGAPSGEYNVSVFWPAPADDSSKDAFSDSKDRLGNRYLDPTKSGLNVKIEEGGTELPPFELK